MLAHQQNLWLSVTIDQPLKVPDHLITGYSGLASSPTKMITVDSQKIPKYQTVTSMLCVKCALHKINLLCYHILNDFVIQLVPAQLVQ